MGSGIKGVEFRDQKGEIWDHSHGSGIQAMGSGSADFEGSGIRLYHFCGIRDQILTRLWNQASKICGTKMGSAMRKHTS